MNKQQIVYLLDKTQYHEVVNDVVTNVAYSPSNENCCGHWISLTRFDCFLLAMKPEYSPGAISETGLLWLWFLIYRHIFSMDE